MFPPSRVVYSCLFFVLVMTLVIVTKPALFFLADGRVRPFGFGQADDGGDAAAAQTPLPLGALTVAAALASMFLFSSIDVVYARPPTPAAQAPTQPPPSQPAAVTATYVAAAPGTWVAAAPRGF